MIAAVAAAIDHRLGARKRRISGQLDGPARDARGTSAASGSTSSEFVLEVTDGSAAPSATACRGTTPRSATTVAIHLSRWRGASRQRGRVRSAWVPGEPVWRGGVGDRDVAVQVRPVPNGFDLAWHGAQARAYVYTETEAAAARLMPVKIAADTGKKLLCPMPGLVVSIAVAVGQEVKAGETLAVVEAMKMENVLRAERDGVVKTIHRQAGRQPRGRCGDHGVRLRTRLGGARVAAIAIPEVMGYTKISGTPVITGLYTMLIPTALFALFGSSRHLVVGADSATAAILAAGLVGIASIGSDQYLALAGVLALMAAVFLILARVMRLGFLADFLSRTVLIGFLTGVGVQVALGQIGGMLGLEGGGHGTLGKLWHTLQQLGEVNRYELMIALAVLVVVVGLKKVSKKIPAELIAVIGSLVASGVFGLNTKLHVLGTVPSGLPHLGLPAVDWHWQVITTLIPTAFAMFVVILAQSAATSRAYATRYDESFSENTDLVGLALANIGAGLSGTFVVNGSPTKTQIVDSCGRPQPTVAPGDGGDRIAGPALPDRTAGVHARSGLVGHRVSHRRRPDRYRRDAEGLRATAIGILGGTDHRIDGRDRWRRTGNPARHRVVAHRSHPPRVSSEERGARAGRIGRSATTAGGHGRASRARSGHLPIHAQLVLRELPAALG